ncbi:MAG: adenylate/guanylate cyclase domain-containing protein [Burkholderiales bacterium]|nr:adenylate/guanylate cyclase domain-containing protein [Burkholderiales bacterium]
MFDRTNRTLICSIVFLDIADYSRQHVAEQIRLKERFNATLSEALLDIAVNDRIILDTGDGAAVSFLGAPEDALFVAMNLRDTCTSDADPDHRLPIRIGINLGPVRQVKDLNGRPNLIGDGINVAQRVMSFAEPGTILVSRSYYEVVSRLSEEYTQLFEYEGMRTDKHVREHEIYTIGNTDVARRHSSEQREASKRRRPASPRVIEQQRSNLRIAAGVAFLACAAGAAGWWGMTHRGVAPQVGSSPTPSAMLSQTVKLPAATPVTVAQPTAAPVAPPPAVNHSPVVIHSPGAGHERTTAQTSDTAPPPAAANPAIASAPSHPPTPLSRALAASTYVPKPAVAHSATAPKPASKPKPVDTPAPKPAPHKPVPEETVKPPQNSYPTCLPGECDANGRPKRDK